MCVRLGIAWLERACSTMDSCPLILAAQSATSYLPRERWLRRAPAPTYHPSRPQARTEEADGRCSLTKRLTHQRGSRSGALRQPGLVDCPTALERGHEEVGKLEGLNGALEADHALRDAGEASEDVLDEHRLELLIVRRLLEKVGADVGVGRLSLEDPFKVLGARQLEGLLGVHRLQHDARVVSAAAVGAQAHLVDTHAARRRRRLRRRCELENEADALPITPTFA
mmetsp:Transcript_59260/g.117709  ORF Transcript_59260/g.117709 Transcript_59260/m.117709 type:complete len:226 (-) Transcript_59260:797-1474(-)